jgi:hypothetical protein
MQVLSLPCYSGRKRLVYLRGFLIWLVIISAEVVHGILRGLLLAPAVGDFRARQIAVFSGIIIIFTIAYFSVRWIRASGIQEHLAVGFMWLFFTVAFEILIGRYVAVYSWERILSDYNMVKGGLLPIGMLAMAFIPSAAAKIRKII